MIRQPQIVVGAKVQHRLLARHSHLGVLRAFNQSLPLEQAGFFNFANLLAEIALRSAVHALSLTPSTQPQHSLTFTASPASAVSL
jgi:hypothetical protein